MALLAPPKLGLVGWSMGRRRGARQRFRLEEGVVPLITLTPNPNKWMTGLDRDSSPEQGQLGKTTVNLGIQMRMAS
jgi:hypothetical protein